MKHNKGKIWKKSLSIFSAVVLILQMMGISNLISIAPKAFANDMCSVDVDVVLIMDRSGSMADGEALSKCEWPEMKAYGGGYTWFLNTKYDVTEEWCNNIRDSFDESEAVFQYIPLNYTPSTNSKMDNAKNAAKSFLDNFKANDQSALVSFADDATLDKPLSNSHLNTKTIIDSLSPLGATDIGDAINEGINELSSVRANPQANSVMVLLTDGKANKPNGNGYTENSLDVQYAKDKAQEAANQGYKIFTVGLGDDGDINQEMLQEIADITGANYHHVPNGEDLTDVYNDIAYEICQYGSISGCKYEDENDNEIIDSGEPGLSEWEIVLTDDASSTPLFQHTDQDGCYNFAGLSDGTYTVSEGDNLDKGTFIQTYPQNLVYENIEISNHNNVENINFANYFPSCGNQILDEGEECDDGNLADGDGCSAICQNEAPPEPVCGDGTTEGTEECDDGNLVNGDGCSDECLVTYQCNDGIDNDQDGLIDFSDDPGCDSLTDNNETDEAPAIQPGDIVINEIMQNPSGTVMQRTKRQWFEVYNNSDKTIDLQNCVLSDNVFNSHTIQNQLSIDAGNYAVLGYSDDKNLNGNVDVDYVYFPGFFLTNSSDQIILTCDGTEIDRVEYDDGATFPDPSGASMILSDPSLDNNDGSNWCESTSSYGDGDLGTPGSANDPCGGIECQQTTTEECVSDGWIEISYTWNHPSCGNDTTEQEEDASCSCEYTEWTNDACVTDGQMGQTRDQITSFDYCTDTTQQVEDSSCASEPSAPTASIEGCKYLDSDKDGEISDETEPLEGWEITLHDGNAPLTAITDENGCYKFENLYADSYVVSESANLDKQPYIQTYPASLSYTVTLSEGQAKTNIDFGNYIPVCGNGIIDENYGEECDDENVSDGDGCSSTCQTETPQDDNECSISGYKFEDADKDKLLDEGESKLGGWEILLFKNNTSTILESQVTDEDGFYKFDHLEPGNYYVKEGENVTFEPFLQTYPTTTFHSLNLVYTENKEDINFGNYLPICGNGIIDTMEGTEEECDDGNMIDGDGCSRNCTQETQNNSGGGGGGGSVYIPLKKDDEGGEQQEIFNIFNEADSLTEDTITVTWETNLESNSRVIYSEESEGHVLDENSPLKYGYAHSYNNPNEEEVTFHTVKIPWLEPCTTYYYRDVSSLNTSETVFSPERSFTTFCEEGEEEQTQEKKKEKEPTGIGGPLEGEKTTEEPNAEITEPEKETEPKEVEEATTTATTTPSNLLASLGGLLKSFGSRCFNHFPWWTLLIFALYPLYMFFVELKKKKSSSIIWSIWTLVHLLTAAIIFFSISAMIPLWIFIASALGSLVIWFKLQPDKNKIKDITIVGLITLLILSILLTALQCLYLWLIILGIIGFIIFVLSTGKTKAGTQENLPL